MLLLATDLDRTVLPNGKEPESPQARPLFRALAAHPQLTLAYVTGRDKGLLMEAIDQFDLPVPDYAIGDVGTTIYLPKEQWAPLTAWQEEIAADWNGKNGDDIRVLLQDIEGLKLQEPERQNAFKVSYYASQDTDRDPLLARMSAILQSEDINASLIWSIDEQKQTGLLDVLPAGATKIHALRFLMNHLGMTDEQTVFCGDSGNDLPALTSGLRAVLVANAHHEVRREAVTILRSMNMEDRLYIAQGGALGMNGNYAAGVLEGLMHFEPGTETWMKGAA